MKVLALDTCFGAVSVALTWVAPGCEPMQRVAYEERTAGHAEQLMPMVAEVMEQGRKAGGPAFAELDRIAVTMGPGTFTGVRTGIAAARALALSAAVPVCGASTLAVMAVRAAASAFAAGPAGKLAVAVDARRGEVYLECFDAGTSTSAALQSLSAPAVLPLDEALDALESLAGGAWIVAGSGAPLLAAAAAVGDQRHAALRIEAILPSLEPRASELAAMAAALPVLETVRPLYLRPPDARPQKGYILPRA